MAGASDFCFPCTSCGGRFDSLRLFRKHKCGTTQDTTPDTNTQKIRKCQIPNVVEEVKIPQIPKIDPPQKVQELATTKMAEKSVEIETTRDLQKGPILNPIQLNDTTLDFLKEGKPFDNKMLGYVVDTTNNKKIEIRSGKFKCILCDTEFPRHKTYERHLLRHKENKTISCDYQGCLIQVFSETGLKSHKLKSHGIEQSVLTCKHCDKVFKSSAKATFDSHLKIHSNIKDFLCMDCGKAFKTKEGLNMHMKMHNNIFDHECKVCGKKFVSKTGLKIHIDTSHTEASFACEFCGNKYTTKTYLKIHITSHTGEMRYSCSCGKQFRRYQTWKNHENMHKDIRNHKCKLCPKEFVRYNALHIHMKRHNNQKDYICPVCRNGFIEPAGLRKHKCLGHLEAR